MKKILGLILCFAMLLNSTLVLAESKLSEPTAEALEILQTLEFINQDYSEETIDFSTELTRAEFADALGKIFNVNNVKGKELYFHDVPADYYAYDSITYLVSIGAINGKGNKQFNPDEKISVTDAAKIILYGLGYDMMVEGNGGYPKGVNATANKLGLLKGVTGTGGNLTYESMFRILYNTIFTEVLDTVGIVNSTIQYEGNGETFLSKNYDIYLEEGIVTGVNGGDYDEAKTKEGQVAINKTVFEANGKDYTDFLGYKVRYLYHYDENNEKYSLIWMKDLEKITALNLSYIENEVSFNSETYKITYLNENDKYKVADIEKTIKVIYNGRMISTGINDVLGGTFETMRLLDLSDNGDYDLAIVYKYDNYIVDAIDGVNGIIYDKFSNDPLDFEAYDELYIYNTDGSLISVGEIPIGCVVSAYPSHDKSIIRAYISITIKEGTLSSYEADDDVIELVVDGEEYTCFYDFIPTNLRLSKNMKLWIDNSGYVAGFEYSSNAEKYAYFIKSYISKESSEESVYVKMFTEDGEMVKYKCRENTKLDNVNYKKYYPEGLYNALGGPQLIRYSLNADGEITMIDTVAEDNASDFNMSHSRKRRVYKGGKFIGFNGNNGDGDSLIMNSSTIIFSVPTDPATAQSYDYQIVKANKVADWRDIWSLEGYSSTKDPFIVDVLVSYGTKPLTWGSFEYMLVNKVHQTLNEDDEVVTQIEGYYGGSEVSVETDPGYTPTDIQRGDVIKITFNNNKSVADVSLQYRKGSNTPGFKYDDPTQSYLLAGDVYDAENRMVKITDPKGPGGVDDIYKVGTVWIYYSNDNHIEKGTVNALVKGDEIVLYTVQGYVSTAYVFK